MPIFNVCVVKRTRHHGAACAHLFGAAAVARRDEIETGQQGHHVRPVGLPSRVDGRYWNALRAGSRPNLQRAPTRGKSVMDGALGIDHD